MDPVERRDWRGQVTNSKRIACNVPVIICSRSMRRYGQAHPGEKPGGRDSWWEMLVELIINRASMLRDSFDVGHCPEACLWTKI